MKRVLFLLLIIVSCAAGALASPRAQVKKGNQAAQQGQADEAMVRYKTALEQQGDSSVILYDLGNLMYSQQQYDAAAKSYMGSFDPQDAPEVQGQSFYNLGNSLFQAQQYEQAIASYVEAIKRNPQDTDARYNLELARRFLKQQQQQQQKQQQNQDQQEQKQDEQQDQQKQQQQDEQLDQQQQQNEQQQNPDEQQQDEQQQSQPQPGQQMSKDEAERLLNALLQNEQNALKDAKKVKVAARAKREKDW